MDILTITCHDCYNYGASLQAYALQTYLLNQGHRVQIIDYKPDYLSQHFNYTEKYQLPSWSRYNKPFLRQLYLLSKLPDYLLSLRKKHRFDSFTNQYLNLTPKRYHNFEQLEQEPPYAQLYIAGSDQIWNTALPNGKDPAFYLRFVTPDSRTASYAASIATEHLDSATKQSISLWLKQFDAISVREKASLPLLKQLEIENAIAVLDPVFLLPAEHWSTLSEQGTMKLNFPYMVIYAFDKTPLKLCCNIISQIKQQHPDLSVYEIGPAQLGLGKHLDGQCGPLQFLYLLKNAAMIVSNSFHATAFSLIFEKNFYVTGKGDKLNLRMKNLMETLHMPERYHDNQPTPMLTPPDYLHIRELLDELRSQSFQYINTLTTE